MWLDNWTAKVLPWFVTTDQIGSFMLARYVRLRHKHNANNIAIEEIYCGPGRAYVKWTDREEARSRMKELNSE